MRWTAARFSICTLSRRGLIRATPPVTLLVLDKSSRICILASVADTEICETELLQVVYSARHEMCESAADFLARRTRLAFTDIRAAEEALPRVRCSPF